MRSINSLLVLPLLGILLGCGKGDPGQSGETIVSGVNCSKADSGSGTSLLIRYESVTYSTGDRFVNCYIGGAGAAYTDSQIYKSGQSGATTGGCQVGADLDAASGGYWQFTSQSGVTKVVFNDVGSASNGYTYTYAASDCSSF